MTMVCIMMGTYLWLTFVANIVSALPKLRVDHGIPYGQDCKPAGILDTNHLNKVTKSEGYMKRFGSYYPIVLLTDEEWTPDMEAVYVHSLLNDPSRCSLIEGLRCQLKQNENTAEVNFHHHHEKRREGPIAEVHEPSLLEPRRADVRIQENLRDFDRISEVDPEWRCTCNPDISVHYGVEVKQKKGSKEHPFYDDQCLMKAGLPCKFKRSPGMNPSSGHFKANYQCIPDAHCVSLFESVNTTRNYTGEYSSGVGGTVADKVAKKMLAELETNRTLADHGSNSTLPDAGVNKTEDESIDDIQQRIKLLVGYKLNLAGVRPAFQNYVLRHLTHICSCLPDYEPNGNGLCVKSKSGKSKLENRAGVGDGNQNGASSGLMTYHGLSIFAFCVLTAIH